MIGTRKSTVIVLATSLIATLACSSCSKEDTTYPQRLIPNGIMKDAQQLAAGESIFHDKCATCHGKPSEGRSDRAIFFQPPAPDFTSTNYLKVDPAYLYWRIEVGKTVEPYRSQGSVMPAWSHHLSETQIWQTVAYLRSRAH